MNFDYNTPIYLQVVQSIKAQIVAGKLKPGDRLPSNLDLAMEYKINPNTVQRIYRELEMDGISFTKRGIGTFVCEDKEIAERLRTEMKEKQIKQFLDGMKAGGFSDAEILSSVKETLEKRKQNA